VSLSGPDPDAREATRLVLGHVLDQLLRLLHPVMPFVTEELWTALTGGESVVLVQWPAVGDGHARTDPEATALIESLMRLVTTVRRFRADQGWQPSRQVPAALTGIGATPLAAHEAAIRRLLRLSEPGDGFAVTATVQAEGVTVELGTSGGIDLAAERRRLAKDLAAAQADAEVTERKLATRSFVERAPAEVVARSRERLAATQSQIAMLTARLTELADAAH